MRDFDQDIKDMVSMLPSDDDWSDSILSYAPSEPNISMIKQTSLHDPLILPPDLSKSFETARSKKSSQGTPMKNLSSELSKIITDTSDDQIVPNT
eukprot:4917489-Pyramimonas_sp.AAC.1